MSDLDPISPEEARDWYISDREDELSEVTLKAHQYRLAPFLEWCGLADIENMNDLRGRHFSKYKLWRKTEKGNPNNVTLNTQLSTLRVFIKWCGKRDIVTRDLYEFIDPPRMAPNEDVRTVTLEAEAAAEILAHLRKYESARLGGRVRRGPAWEWYFSRMEAVHRLTAFGTCTETTRITR